MRRVKGGIRLSLLSLAMTAAGCNSLPFRDQTLDQRGTSSRAATSLATLRPPVVPKDSRSAPPAITRASESPRKPTRERGKLLQVSAEEPSEGDTSEAERVLSQETPLDLPTILLLVDSQNPQILLARERILEAYAQADRADVLWLPSVRAGANFNKHEGAIQDVAGNVFNTSRSAAFGGLGANVIGAGSPSVPGIAANFHIADALFQPRIADFRTAANQFSAEVTRNDFLRDATVAYWELVRSEQVSLIARDAVQNTRDLAELTRTYAETGQGLRADSERMLAELALREAEVLRAEEAVRVNSAELARLLRADPTVVVRTTESVVLPLDLTPPDVSPAELVGIGLSHRPELGESRHLAAEACERLRRERYAPLVPSVLLGVTYGGFGGGLGGTVTNVDHRLDADVVAYWEVRNLGLGERAIRNEASSRVRQARWREVAVLDRVAKDVVAAHAQIQTRSARIPLIKNGIDAARQSFALNRERIQNAQGLPIEALQSIQSLSATRREYVNAVVDYNIAQFQLWWALGWQSDPIAAAVLESAPLSVSQRN